jgi:hypothetical protein
MVDPFLEEAFDEGSRVLFVRRVVAVTTPALSWPLF